VPGQEREKGARPKENLPHTEFKRPFPPGFFFFFTENFFFLAINGK
jgi:hypothetical protein